MAREDSEIVGLAREVLECLGRRDPDRLVELSHPEVEWHSFFAVGEGGAYSGHDGTRRYISDLSDAFEVGLLDVYDALALDGLALLVGQIRYRGKGSGVESISRAGWLLEFRDGRLLSFRAFRDPERALRALAD